MARCHAGHRRADRSHPYRKAPVIIPRPSQAQPRPGHFQIPPALHLAIGPGADRPAALLAHYLGPDRPRTRSGPAVALDLDAALGHLGPEGYTLEIRTDAVRLAAPAEAGLFHGVQTLRQLLPPETERATAEGATSGDVPADAWRWPCASISDSPRLPWRGMLLDVARHYLPVEFLRRFVDQLALHKLNVLHLHLTDDQGWRIEIDGLPRLAEIGAWRTESMIGPDGSTTYDGVPHGGFYTRRELRELVAYAEARGVTIVPEIDMPGHVRAMLAAYPHLGNHPERHLPVWTGWGVSEDILSVQDETLDFCREVLARTIEIFPSRFVHIGGDECPTVQWADSPSARQRAAELGLATPAALHGWFLSRMQDFLTGEGRGTVCWDEAGESGELSTDAVLAAWRDAAHGVQAIDRGHRVIMAPHGSTFLDYPQSDSPDEPAGQPERLLTLSEVYHFDPLAGGLSAAPEAGTAGVLGTQAQLWTEFVSTPAHALYLIYPRLCALAETAWSAGPRDYEGFLARLAVHSRRLRLLGVPEALGGSAGELATASAPAENILT